MHFSAREVEQIDCQEYRQIDKQTDRQEGKLIGRW